MEEDMDEGQLKVTQGPDFFTMAVLEPSLGNGIYWCGVLSQNNTMIKLAERYFHSSPGVYIWSFTRWILLPLLPLTTIFTNIYTRAQRDRDTGSHLFELFSKIAPDCTESPKSDSFFEKKKTPGIHYEEISLHLLDKPNIGKLT
ncbi:hypothetical protein GBF38_003899 [Nibea albiflora]|uniref:Uncharacterized protein n=1 Tax=Nibea albiflora TaxID=240163 RepID=A0ACB7FBQ9_NIBAL|nr:hypothetical protein GBF38_003899 [Nibea albiflora]